jgi:hypothetical protein
MKNRMKKGNPMGIAILAHSLKDILCEYAITMFGIFPGIRKPPDMRSEIKKDFICNMLI